MNHTNETAENAAASHLWQAYNSISQAMAHLTIAADDMHTAKNAEAVVEIDAARRTLRVFNSEVVRELIMQEDIRRQKYDALIEALRESKK
jgi:hypothetical protein